MPPRILPVLDRLRHNYYVMAVGNGDALFDQNVKLAHALDAVE